MKDLGMTQRRHVGASCAVGALSFLFVAIGCDSGGGGDDGSGGATSASGGGVGDGGSSAGGFQNGASGGGESSGAAPGNGGSGGAASSGGAVGAAGGQGGARMNDPMCPAEQPTHEAACFVNLVVVCSYEGTNCACVSGEWDCEGCPSEFVLTQQGKDCTGYEGEACRGCQCPTTSEPKWECPGSDWQARACAMEGLVFLEYDGDNGCIILRLSSDTTDCVGDVRGDGYCIQRASLYEGVGCHVPTGGDGPIWRADAVTGSLAIAGDAETPIVTLDVTIEYDPESASGEPPPNDMIQVDSCAADCSATGCE
jgi:hypothetical protein